MTQWVHAYLPDGHLHRLEALLNGPASSCTEQSSFFTPQRGTHGELAAVDGRPYIGVVPKAAAEALRVQILWDGVARVPEPVLDLQGVRHPTPQRARLHMHTFGV